MVVGAAYHFEVYTTSDGYDPTNSVSVHITAKFGKIFLTLCFTNTFELMYCAV